MKNRWKLLFLQSHAILWITCAVQTIESDFEINNGVESANSIESLWSSQGIGDQRDQYLHLGVGRNRGVPYKSDMIQETRERKFLDAKKKKTLETLLDFRESRRSADETDCRKLQSQILNVSMFGSALLSGQDYRCVESQILLSTANISIGGSHIPGETTVLIGSGATIRISAQNISLHHLTLIGDWRIEVDPGGSLFLNTVQIDRARVGLAQDAELRATGLSVSRRWGGDVALSVNATSATVHISNSVFRDGAPGALLAIRSSAAFVSLSNVSFESTDPLLSPDLLGVFVTGLSLQLHRSSVAVTSAHFRWCGLGALRLAGAASNLTVSGSTFFQNTAVSSFGDDVGGGAIGVSGPALSVAVVGCSIVGHWSDTRGGGISLIGDDAHLVLRDSTLDANQAGEAGGAVGLRGARGVLTIEGCRMRDNIVFGFDGGAVAFQGTGGAAQVDGSLFAGNIAYRAGGALFLSGARVVVERSVLEGNVATRGGGACIVAGEAQLADSLFRSNLAGGADGGGVCFEFCDSSACGPEMGNLNVGNCTFDGNSAEDGGGIAVIGWGRAKMSDSLIEGNVAFGSGGGVLHNRTGQSPYFNSRTSELEMTSCAVAGNFARHGDGGGLAALNGGIRLFGSSFVGNEATLGSGGGLTVSGYPYGSTGGVWTVEKCVLRDNLAGESGGGVASKHLFFSVDTVASGFGIPFALLADLTVLCRGYGAFNDRNVVAFNTRQSTLEGGLNETLFDVSISPALDADALVADISKDNSVVLMYLNWKYQLVAVNVSNGKLLSFVNVPAISSYTRINRVAGSLSDTLPILIPKIADTNYYWYYVYGGWGLSSLVTDKLIFVSTFHKTVVFHVSNASFQELTGCESGVSAMAISAGNDSIFLARYSGSGYAFSIFQYFIYGSVCLPYIWKEEFPEFKQVRALAASADGESIYLAESYEWVDQLVEYQIIKMVNLKSGAVSIFSSSPTSYLLLESVVAILPPSAESLSTEIYILCASGGWLGGADGQDPIAWRLHKIRTGELKMSNVVFLKNSAYVSGGAIAASDVSVLRVEKCVLTENYATKFGGAAICKDSTFLSIVESNIESNKAGESGGGIYIPDSAQVILKFSNFSSNSAQLCGGAIVISGTKNLVLAGLVLLERNSAGNGGGMCVIRPGNQSYFNVNRVDMMLTFSAQSKIIFRKNLARKGGGALFNSDLQAWRDELDSGGNQGQISILGHDIFIFFEDNYAGYGQNIATLPSTFVLLNKTSTFKYYPGQKLQLLLVIEDGLGQAVKYNGNIIPLSVSIRTSSKESGLISETYHGFNLNGVCDLETTPPQVFWPSRDLEGERIFDSIITLTVQPITDQMQLSPIVIHLSRLPCPGGTSYDTVTQSCVPCLRSQYVLPPNDFNKCKDCPLGALCDGSKASARVARSIWRRVEDTLRISECPAGYILVRDETQPITDDCIKCPAGKFQSVPSIYNLVEENKIWSATASNASYLCQDCPDGYKCPGGEEIEPADIEVFPWNSSIELTDIASTLQCKTKLAVCGFFEIQDEIRFVFTDNRVGIKSDADISYLVIAGDTFLNGSSARKLNSSENRYFTRFNLTDLGIHILAVYLDGVQIPNSPFLFAVTKRSCTQHHGRISDLRGNCVCAELASLDIGGTCVSLILLAISSAVTIAFVSGVVYCIRNLLRSEEDQTRRVVDGLRAKLGLSKKCGIILSSDVYPIWRNPKFLVFIQRSYLEAAARLALFRDDCDVKLVNGLCTCLLERPQQYGLFCDWLLSISSILLDPSVNITMQSTGVSVNETHIVVPGRRVRNIHNRKVHCSMDFTALNQHRRFQYFTEKVSKIQAMRDLHVFEKVQALTQEIMDKVAGLCDCRYEELSREPFGSELLSSKFAGVVDVSTTSPLAPSVAERFFLVNGSIVSRQDSDQVEAIRTDEINRKEAMQQILAQSSNFPSQPLNEGVFLAQLSLRAELLNQAFQSAVAEFITAHAATDHAIAAAASCASPQPLNNTQSRDGNIVPGREHSIAWMHTTSASFQKKSHEIHNSADGVSAVNETLSPRVIECQFLNDIDTVEIHPAPIKSLRRMQEKLSEYLMPSPKGIWPLAANILDPMRLSLVTNGPSHLIQVVQWFLEKPGTAGLTVCRLKNLFALQRGLVPDGYRDIKLFVCFSGPDDLKLIGEVQIHDRAMYNLKQRMHYLYRIKRAQGPESI